MEASGHAPTWDNIPEPVGMERFKPYTKRRQYLRSLDKHLERDLPRTKKDRKGLERNSRLRREQSVRTKCRWEYLEITGRRRRRKRRRRRRRRRRKGYTMRSFVISVVLFAYFLCHWTKGHDRKVICSMHWVGETELHVCRLRISLHVAAESVLREIHYQVALIILARRGKHQ